MITLSDSQIDFLEQEITKRGIKHPDLGHQLLDHFACGIEEEMDKGLGFHEAYHKMYMQISPNGLEEIDHSLSLVILHQKYSIMKKFVFITGFSFAFMFGVGIIFKNMHWPYANILITSGATAFTLAFLPMYFRLKYLAETESGHARPALNYVLNCLLVMVMTIALPYRFLEWPGASWILLLGQCLLAFVFLPKVFLGWYKKFEGPAQTV